LRGVGGFARFEPPAGIEQRAFARKQFGGEDECENENGKLAHGRIMPMAFPGNKAGTTAVFQGGTGVPPDPFQSDESIFKQKVRP
jgi:hypothetical protein